ncbi:MAG: DUF4124 domain-containing protein [Zhongshania sp.]|uniref:DUF4124 domain-containing protein n=1 Tax=Zhongshania sp. TaxID=1971902 RepID=UPI00260A98F7|nr:DUF4124 domain-containing protein [Zhongshania sp.]MDF1694088.1 DUF4124 domain-containing protein [Zhongshania sp.]
MQVSSAVLTLMLVWFSPSLAAELYQWVDKNGHRVYSDTKPADGTSYTVRSQQSLPPLLTTQSVAVKRPATKVRSAASASKIATDTGKSHGNSYYCASVKSQLNAIKAKLRKGDTNGNGERLRDQRTRLTKELAEHCRR